MSENKNIPDLIKEQLNDAIMQTVAQYKELYELGLNVSAAAFSKRRKNLSWLDFENVFELFNEMQTDYKTYRGIAYMLLMVPL